MSLLADYIVKDLFKWYREERQNKFEFRWRRAYDAFRGQYNSGYLTRWRATEGKDWRSKVFVRLTKAKVYAGYNQVVGVAGQGGQMPWGLSPSPKPSHGMMQVHDMDGRCDRMREQIEDDFRDGRAVEAWEQGVLEAAIYGLSWLRGPVLRSERRAVSHLGPAGFGLHVKEIEIPKVELPGVWNVFWDLEAADPQQGTGIIIRDMMTPGKFLDLAGRPGFDRKAVMAVEAQYREQEGGGVEDESEGPIPEDFTNRKQIVPVYRFWGRVPKRFLSGRMDVGDGDGREVEIQAVCAGDSPQVIFGPKPAVLPYRNLYCFNWETMPGESNATGIPENMEDTQSVVNGLTRAMLDNKALASNLLIGFKGDQLSPGQNKMLYPGKMFEMDPHTDDIRQALQFFSPPDNTRGMEGAIEFFRNWADEETGINRMMGGQEAAPNRTAFELSKMVESGNKMVGGIIRNNDHGHIEPLVRAFYHFHMLTNPDDSLKGDFTPEATGFKTYREKERVGAQLFQILQFGLANEAVRSFFNIANMVEDWIKTTDLDIDRVMLSDDEREIKELRSAQAPPDPEAVKDQAEAAEAQAQAQEAAAQAEAAEVELQKAGLELQQMAMGVR